MTLQLHSITAADYPRVAELLSLTASEPVTVALLKEWEAAADPKRVRRWLGAANDQNEMVAILDVGRDPWMHEGRYWLEVTVDPTHRRQGIGSQLYEEGLKLAQVLGAKTVRATIRDNDDSSLQFALKRGFHHDRHSYESVLDLRTFDETPFVPAITRCEAQGFRFASLAALGNTPEWRKQLYHVNRTAGLDVPGNSGNFWDFDQFTRNVFDASWFNADGQILAIEGDKAVGLGAVGYEADTNSSYSAFSGVLREYRGRGLAQALKLMTIRKAISWGADYIRTHNDSTNAPMLSINRRFGYKPEPGIYYLLKEV
jgi:GNAT superfamily N-acetyltransferase